MTPLSAPRGYFCLQCEWNHFWLSEGFAVLSANLWHEYADGRTNMEERLAAERARVIAFQKSNPEYSVVCRACYDDLFQLLNDLNYRKVGSMLKMFYCCIIVGSI